MKPDYEILPTSPPPTSEYFPTLAQCSDIRSHVTCDLGQRFGYQSFARNPHATACIRGLARRNNAANAGVADGY